MRLLRVHVVSIITVFLFLVACQDGGAWDGFRRRGAEFVREGSKAPSFSLPGLSGNLYTEADFSGKIVLVNFWATWCSPCLAEMPALERLYKMFQGKGFGVVAVNVDPADDEKRVREFVKSRGLTFPVLLDQSVSLPPQFGVQGLPESFFLDPEGRFLAVFPPDSSHPELPLKGDRPWDSKEYVNLVADLLERFRVSQ